MTTPELMNKTESVRELYIPRTLQVMKRDKELANGPYEYLVRACLKVENR